MEPLTYTLITAITGAIVYLWLLNHHLFAITDGKMKLFACLSVLLFLVLVVPTAAFFIGPRWPFPQLLYLILFITLCGEMRRFYRKKKYRGAFPVEVNGPAASIFRPVTTYDLVSLRYEIPCKLVGQQKIRTTLLSDFHINEYTDPSLYEKAMEMARASSPDLLIFGGDYLGPLSMKDRMGELLQTVRGRLGTFGVIGNHDHWFDREAIVETLKSVGVEMLGNTHQLVTREDGLELLIAGCESPWSAKAWSPIANELPKLRIVASHTPDNIFHLAQESEATLVLSGHTHAGQGRIPGYGPALIPSVHGRLFDHGHYIVDKTHLVVSAGVGVQIPLRLWCQPDITIVDLIPAKS